MYVKPEIPISTFSTPPNKSTLKGISVLKNVGLNKYIVFLTQ
jgi:hypothetical protein